MRRNPTRSPVLGAILIGLIAAAPNLIEAVRNLIGR